MQKGEKFINLLITKLKTKIEWQYLIIVVVFGLFFALLVPPGFNHDEKEHYLRVNEIANGQIIPQNIGHPTEWTKMVMGSDVTEDNLKDIPNAFYGGVVSEDVAKMLETGAAQTYSKDYHFSFPWWASSEFDDSGDIGINYGNKIEVANTNTAIYSPIVYLPQVIAVKAGQLFNLSNSFTFILSRLLGFLATTLLIFLAIKLIPIGSLVFKRCIMFLCILPPMLIQLTAVSADGMTVGICLLFTAVILRYIKKYQTKNSNLKNKDILVLCVLVFLIALLKITYFPIICLLFSLPIACISLRDKNDIIKICSIFGFGVIVFFVWYLQINLIHVGQYYFGNKSDPAGQIDWVLASSDNFNTGFHAIWNSLLDNRWDDTSASPVWVSLANEVPFRNIKVPGLLFVMLYFGFALVLVKSKKSDIKMNKILRTLIFLLGAGSIALISIALYFEFTPVGMNSVWGVQARYYLPLIPLMIIPFFVTSANKKISKKSLKIKQPKTLAIEIITVIYIISILSVTIGCLHSIY
ncbi:MAG: DUF2142 domain-containing protein [Candidatus Ancillula sp.]|nr:DUF2142 domain-containing protein [Candidatus Ancillula sp.]